MTNLPPDPWAPPLPLDAAIPCRVYWIWGPHPVTGVRCLVYVGECVDTANRGPADRFAEHLELQPWGDTIPHRTYADAIAHGTLVVSTTVYATKRHARVAERDAIIAGRPLYNWKCNELNPIQIPRWEQGSQRADRDRDRGIPKHRTWAVVHGGQNVTGWRRVLAAWARLRPRQRSRIIWATVGVNIAVTAGVALSIATPLSLLTSLGAAAGGLAVLVLWANRPSKRRKFRYALNEAARYAVLGAVIVQLLYDLFL